MIPVDNAIVGGIFPSDTATKIKPRSKTQTKFQDALVRIQSHVLSNATCCKDFECTVNITKLHNSVDLYGQNENCSTNDDETEIFEGILHQLASIVNKMQVT